MVDGVLEEVAERGTGRFAAHGTRVDAVEVVHELLLKSEFVVAVPDGGVVADILQVEGRVLLAAVLLTVEVLEVAVDGLLLPAVEPGVHLVQRAIAFRNGKCVPVGRQCLEPPLIHVAGAGATHDCAVRVGVHTSSDHELTGSKVELIQGHAVLRHRVSFDDHAAEFVEVSVEPAVVGRRAEAGEEFRFHRRPRHVQRVVQVHLEADRAAADQAHLHALPVFVRRVLHDRPPLQVRLLPTLRVQHQAVTRLPDRGLDHVADLNLPLTVPGEVQAHGLLLAVVVEREYIQRAAEFALDQRVREAELLHLAQLHGAEPFRAPEVEHFDRGLLLHLPLDADDCAVELAGLVGGVGHGGHFDAFAAGLGQNAGERRVAVQVDGERRQRAADGFARIVAHRRDVSVAEIFEYHALEQVVDVRILEREIDAGIALDFAGP